MPRPILVALAGLCCLYSIASGQVPQYVTAGTQIGVGVPRIFTKDSNSNKTQIIFKDSIFPGIIAGKIINVYFKSATTNAGFTTLSSFSIKMGYTQADTFAFIRDTDYSHTPPIARLRTPFLKGLTTVLSSPSYTISKPVTSGSWVKFPLQTPFNYIPNTEQNLVLEVSQGPDTPINGFAVYCLQGSPYMQEIFWRAGTDTAAGGGGTQFRALTGFDMVPLGVNELRKVSDLAVYPNPGNGQLNVSFNTMAPVRSLSISLFNCAGQLAFSSSFRQHAGECKVPLDLASLPKGLYSLCVKADDEILVRSIVLD